MKARSKIITLALLILFFVGLSLLLYPAISQYWNSKVQSKAVSLYENNLMSMSADEYSQFFRDAYDYNQKLSELDFPYTDYNKIDGYENALDVNGKGMMGYVDIDKIQVKLPIYHGTSDSVLAQACGHLEGSSLPVGGEGTHAVLSAHRGLPSAKLFTNLDKMQIGDIFTVTILDRVLTYQVDQIKIVKPNDLSYITAVPKKDYCTLLTCTPYGINTHRLLIRGVRVPTVNQKALYINSEAYLVDRIIVMPIVALPILFVLIVYVFFKPVRKKPKINTDDEDEEGDLKYE